MVNSEGKIDSASADHLTYILLHAMSQYIPYIYVQPIQLSMRVGRGNQEKPLSSLNCLQRGASDEPSRLSNGVAQTYGFCLINKSRAQDISCG